MLEPNKIHLGDCLELMADIPDGSIDMILADLPYGTLDAAKWDKRIDLTQLWPHYKRVIKPNGAIALTAKQPYTTILGASNLEWLRYDIVWKKSSGGEFLNANRKPLPRHETILIFARGETTYNPQMRKGKPYACTSAGVGSVTKDKSVIGWKTVNTGERYPTSVWEIPNDTGLHPTQKPVKLFSRLIKTYTNPGEVVLDNVIGSGTTFISCIDTGRNCIGIEKDPNYYQIANERIAKRLQQPFLPGIIEAPEEIPNQLPLLTESDG